MIAPLPPRAPGASRGSDGSGWAAGPGRAAGLRRPARAVAAELSKLRTLPAVALTVGGTVATAIALAAALAAGDVPGGPVGIALRTVPFLQVGLVVLGVVAASSEYAGRQIRTTLTAVPARGTVLAGKAVACLAAALVTSAAAVGVAFGAAWWVVDEPAARGASTASGGAPEPWWSVVGAVVYLALIGLLAHVVAVLLRSLVPPLVAVLGVVLVVSPLLAGFTEHARWLPDRAGGLLYLPADDALLTPGTGALVLAAWIVAVGTAAAGTFLTRDA